MSSFEYLPLEDVDLINRFLTVDMHTEFLIAYRIAAGNADRLHPGVRVKRDAEIRKRIRLDVELWDEEDEPTPAHLRLIALAYTPKIKRLDRWIAYREELDGSAR